MRAPRGKALAGSSRAVIHRGVDIIRIAGIKSFGHHGALPEEKRLGQRFTVSVDLVKSLHFMMTNPNQVLKKEQILNHVWEYDFGGNTAIVESYVSYLRKKLDEHTSESVIITKRGVGYMFRSTKKA